jgi:hypothetical protein
VICAHVPGDVFSTRDPETPVFVENAGGRLLTAAQVAAWCRAPETTKVTVKNVIDLNEQIRCPGYTPSEALVEQSVSATARACSRTAPDWPGPATWTMWSRTPQVGRRPATTSPACAGCTIG